jgi:uncharacterized protein (TIGR03437 family)
MLRVLTALLVCVAAQAATETTNLSINAGVSISGSSFLVTGPATFTGQFAATGTFNATVPATALGGSPTVAVNYTITLAAGTLTGVLQVPVTVLEGQTTSATGSGTITSGSGTYAGYSGTFPSLSGSGGIGASGITLTFSGAGTITTTGGGTTQPVPTISLVADAASYTVNIAEGSIFVVRGSNLCANGTVFFQYPLPTTSGGATGTMVTFTPAAGGSGTQAYLIDTYNANNFSQIAAVLPSTLAAGSYTVTVSYNGSTSAGVAVTVVKQKPTVFSQDTSGSGLGVIQNIVSASEYDINRLTTGSVNGASISPAKPGQTIVIYLTGLGPVPQADNQAESAYDFTKNGVTVSVTVGGTSIPAIYAGRVPGESGLDQIDITLPTTIPTGCAVTLQIAEGNLTSGAMTIAIAPGASDGACVQPGYTSTQLAALDNGGTITTGGFSITSFNINVPGQGSLSENSVGGGFSQISGFQLQALSSLPGSFSENTIGSCTVITVTVNSSGQQVVTSGVVTALDAGTVKLSGPTGSGLSATALTDTNGAYSLSIGSIGGITLPGSVNGSIVAGSYSLSGAGGAGVGSFNTSLTLGSPLNINGGLPSAVNRSQPLVLGWTGGNSTDVVSIVGYSGSSTGSGANILITATEFICTTTAGTGGYTVPTSVLSQLPATLSAVQGGSGVLEVTSGPAPASFTAPLTAGGTVNATFSASSGTASTVTYN